MAAASTGKTHGQMDAKEVISLLGLEPLPVEGGYFRRTWTNAAQLATAHGERPAATAIYYLIDAGSFSEMHQLASDEIYHFYLGDAVELLELMPGGASRVTVLGHELARGQQVQHVVPAGAWQGSRLVAGGRWALLGCTMCPGFDEREYTRPKLAELLRGWPAEEQRIRARFRG